MALFGSTEHQMLSGAQLNISYQVQLHVTFCFQVQLYVTFSLSSAAPRNILLHDQVQHHVTFPIKCSYMCHFAYQVELHDDISYQVQLHMPII